MHLLSTEAAEQQWIDLLLDGSDASHTSWVPDTYSNPNDDCLYQHDITLLHVVGIFIYNFKQISQIMVLDEKIIEQNSIRKYDKGDIFSLFTNMHIL